MNEYDDEWMSVSMNDLPNEYMDEWPISIHD